MDCTACMGDPEACIIAQHIARNCQAAHERAAAPNKAFTTRSRQPHQEVYNWVACEESSLKMLVISVHRPREQEGAMTLCVPAGNSSWFRTPKEASA